MNVTASDAKAVSRNLDPICMARQANEQHSVHFTVYTVLVRTVKEMRLQKARSRRRALREESITVKAPERLF